MNKAETGINGLAGGPVDQGADRRERLSALADGQLQGDELSAAFAYAAEDEEGAKTWQLYHLVGDVLRSADLAQPANPAFMARLREQLAQEALPERPQVPVPVAVVAAGLPEAANASVFRWKMVAGFASLAAVAAMGWNALGHLQEESAGPQLAAAPATAPVQVAATGNPDTQVMIRDPRLDELLAAHKQYSGTTALQMPAGFLRNANFDSPAR